MSPPFASDGGASSIVLRALYFAGAGCLALITLVYPGATRMWAWPWSLALAGALLCPAIALMARTSLARMPMALPTRSWCWLAMISTGVVLVSALASPYRGPSIRWSSPLLGGVAVFFLTHAWLHDDATQRETRRQRLAVIALVAFALIGGTSLWLGRAAVRNSFPLGHANYTAGLALLMLPTAVGVAWRRRDALRWLGAAVALMAMMMLFTSASRGGVVGIAVLMLAGIGCAPFGRKHKILLGAVGAVAALIFAAANPRTRTMLTHPLGSESPLAISDVQRSAMLTAAWQMGAERPWLGWGPGTTPLVYPRFRGALRGGAENVLQLHSLPAQAWAELGAAGLGCLLAFVALVVRDHRRDPVAAVTLLGYGGFSLTDWQLDIPIFAIALAMFAARCASPEEGDALRDGSRYRRAVGIVAFLALAVVALLGRADPAPEMNTRALALARDPAQTDRAIALLRASLALNADQEIAHFNLGWLLLVRDPKGAERHFRAAARLVPDKGGVYFGLGLAQLNQGGAPRAARAFALECLNDPAFMASPWWREPAIAAVRDRTESAFRQLATRARALVPGHAEQLASLEKTATQLGRAVAGPERVYPRERTGYPVLMRNLNLAPPLDLYDVRELQSPPPWCASLPPKGWLPSPALLRLLDEPAPPKT